MTGPPMRALLPDLLSTMAQQRPDAPALTHRDETLTYARLWRLVDHTAAGLQREGVRRGDRVAVYLDKRVETVCAIFGSAAAGAVAVPVNPLLKPRQVAHILDDSEARVLVTSPERLAGLAAALAGCKRLECVVLVGSGAPAGPAPDPRVVGWDDLCGRGGGTAAGDGTADRDRTTRGDGDRTAGGGGDRSVRGAGVIDADMAAILYTSGSTGAPKGVVLSHRNLVAGAESVAHYLDNRPDDVLLAALPLSFDAGLSQLTTGFLAGAHVVLLNYLVPGDVVRACAAHGVTGLTGVPPLWIQLAEQRWPVEATRSLRYFANTGGRLPRPVLRRLRSIFPRARPYLMYGLTEAFRSTFLDPSEVDRRPDSIGTAVPNAEILVVRPDGSPCEPGEVGELVHRGALVAMGYWNDPQRTAERFRPVPGRPGGLCVEEVAVWSGDAVVRDRDGFLYFVGRMDDMIKTSGYRVSPTEIEEAAYESGLVRDAVAVGRPDDRLGEHIVLVVTPAAGVELDRDRLLADLRERLPRYLVPRHVVIRSELPRSPNGKFDRARLREEVAG